MTKHITIL